MSKRMRVTLAVLFIVTGVLLFLPSGYISAAGLVVNPGFEYGEDADPVGWVLSGNAMRVRSGPIHEGTWVARVTGQGDVLTQWTGDITAMAAYEAWGWIYVSGNVTGVIAFDFWAGRDGTQLSPTIMLSATDTNNAYVQTTSTIETPPGTTHLRIRLLGTDWSDGGEVRFDGIGVWPAPQSWFGDWCFIATAAYGSPMAEEIQILREFRDGYLLTNPAGKAMVDVYYGVSPPLAEFITEHPALKPIVRAGLAPAIALSAVAVNSTPTEKTVMVGLLALVLVILVVRTTTYHTYDRASLK
ncbi:MAG: CFI-box-CTERM domain-containing protein [Dehalococcoidia bacterium]